MARAVAVSGVATVERSTGFRNPNITIVPTSASGTGSVEIRPSGAGFVTTAYEPVFQEDGSSPFTVPMAAQRTVRIEGMFFGLKVRSTNSSDDFTIVVSES